MRFNSHIRALFTCVVLLAAAAPAEASARTHGMSRAERVVVRRVNALRRAYGKPSLAPNRHLARAADAHSRDMLRAGFFAHDSSNGQSAYDRVQAYRRSSLMGETLAYMPARGDASPQNIVNMWIASPPHLATLLTGRLRRIGVSRRHGTLFGEPVVVWTADFGSAR